MNLESSSYSVSGTDLHERITSTRPPSTSVTLVKYNDLAVKSVDDMNGKCIKFRPSSTLTDERVEAFGVRRGLVRRKFI